MESMAIILTSLILLIVLSGFFSASETALTSLDKIKLKNKALKGNSKAILMEKIIEKPHTMLIALLIGNNIVNILAASLATSFFTRTFGAIGVTLSTLVLTPIILIFAEIMPKSIAANYPYKISSVFITPLNILMKLLKPFVFLLDKITYFLLKLVGIELKKVTSNISEEEIRLVVNLGEKIGSVKKHEKQMIQNVFDFDDIPIKHIMVPRTDVNFLAEDASFTEVKEIIMKTQFSRIPIYKDNLDNITGILYVKDLLFLTQSEIENFDLTKFLREAFFVSEFMCLHDLFKEMTIKKTHIAIVVGEHGGTNGIIALEDLIEELLGEIKDEYDAEENLIEKIDEYTYMLNGRMRIEDLNKQLNINLSNENSNTIGGFILEQVGCMPIINQKIEYKDYTFIIEKMEFNRIEKIKLFLPHAEK